MNPPGGPGQGGGGLGVRGGNGDGDPMRQKYIGRGVQSGGTSIGPGVRKNVQTDG